MEYAIVTPRENNYLPCHVEVYSIRFYEAIEAGFDADILEDGEDGFIIKSAQGLRRKLNTGRIPLVMMCILDTELKKSQLARDIWNMRAVARFSGKNPNHENRIFHDIWFDRKGKKK